MSRSSSVHGESGDSELAHLVERGVCVQSGCASCAADRVGFADNLAQGEWIGENTCFSSLGGYFYSPHRQLRAKRPYAYTSSYDSKGRDKHAVGTCHVSRHPVREQQLRPSHGGRDGPMRAEYLAELGKIHEPPEMAGKPMQVRKPVSATVLKLGKVLDGVRSPEKATHEQRAADMQQMLEMVNSKAQDDGLEPGAQDSG